MDDGCMLQPNRRPHHHPIIVIVMIMVMITVMIMIVVVVIMITIIFQVVHVLYQENDWVYVISEDSKEGFIPYRFFII